MDRRARATAIDGVSDVFRDTHRCQFYWLMETVRDGIICVDGSGDVVFWNRAAEGIFGYSAGEVLGRSGLFIAAERFRGDLQRRVRRAVVAGPSTHSGATLEVAGLRKDGSEVPIELSVVPWKSGEQTFFTIIARDITERKRLEEQLLHAQRLEAAGRVAAQVAHDLGNLLAPLVTLPSLIKTQLPGDHPAVPMCDTMLESARQIADINEEMMVLSRRGHSEERPVDLNLLVRHTLGSTVSAPATLVVDLDLTPNVLPTMGSPAQLLRVISNLVSNARDAMQDAGLLHIKTENVRVDRALEPSGRPKPGEYVRLSVTDTGCGIPPEIGDRVFSVFFTTKRSGKRVGSGLGLSIVRMIVEDHHGYVGLESEMGNGTTFTVYLPACRDAVEEPVGAGLRGGTETLLVVDDHQLQRRVWSESLRALRYRVEVAASGEEALAHLKEHPADLLILDVVMAPGIDGVETFRRALAMRPGQRAIFISGFAESGYERGARSLGSRVYLRKPVTIAEMSRAVREELERDR